MNRDTRRQRVGLLVFYTMVVFFAIVVNMLAAGTAAYLLVRAGLISVSSETLPHIGRLIVYMALISIPIGIVLSLLASKTSLKPIQDLIAGMKRLASGDFKARITISPLMKLYPSFAEACDSFNKMAQELESTEMLRSDFVNNFSHEFKTPIVSISGFAKLLNRGNLTPAQQKEYLQVIEEESLRLSYMATNVLNLTKVENQTILTDVTRFNLSEQIRSCILLLENKWERKKLEFRLYLSEHEICANEELLKQVWINLLDNAVKFSPEGRVVEVRAAESEHSYTVSILNSGSQIPPEQQEKIFHKFYQADESHAAEGNGVGLAIVKQIVLLHNGRISVTSESDVTVFTVELPKGF